MAPLKCLRIISYSSQDPCHKVENVINPHNTKKWLCSKDSVGGNLEVEIELECSSRIEHINIANHGSNFVEILVGRSMWNKERRYEVLLPAVTLMTPVECKEWKNISKVFMFSSANFHGHIAVQKWDRIRIKCRQPLVKEKQFGLGFVELRAPDAKKKASDLDSNGKKGIRGSDTFKNVVNKALHSLGGSESSSGKALSRSARCLQTALSKQKKPEIKSPAILRSSSKETDDLEFSSDDEYDYKGRKNENGSLRSTLQNRRHNESFKDVLKREKELTAYGNVNRSFGKSKPFASRKPKNFVSIKFEAEVQDFLKEFNIDTTRLKSVQVSDIRKMMEEMRGSRLNNAEKQVFFTVVGKALTKAISPKDEVSNSLAIKSDSEANMPIKDNAKARTQASRENLTSDETPVCKDKSTAKRRNLLTCRNVLCYEDDIEGPPRKKLNAPLEFAKKKEEDDGDDEDADESRSACPICGDLFSKITLEIHASYCEGKSILEDDSQPTDENADIENNPGPRNRKAESETQPGPSNVTSLSVTEHVAKQLSTPVNSTASQNIQNKSKTNISAEPMNSSVFSFSTANSNKQRRPGAALTAATGHLQNQHAAVNNSAARNSVPKKGNNPTSLITTNSSMWERLSVGTKAAEENFHKELEAVLNLSVNPNHAVKKKHDTKKSSKAINGTGLNVASSNRQETSAATAASRQNGTQFTALKDPKARPNTPKINSKTSSKRVKGPDPFSLVFDKRIETRLGANVNDDVIVLPSSTPPVPPSNDPDLLITKVQPSTDTKVACPICMEEFPSSYISYHANLCAEFS